MSGERVSRMSAWCRRAAKISVSLLVGILMAEVAVRMLAAAPLLPAGYPAGLYEADEALGHSLAPGFEGVMRRGKWGKNEVEIRINDDGYRGAAYDAGSSDEAIVVLGDSFAFGHGVGESETFSHVLEEGLESAGRRVQVVNLGVPGYNTFQELAQFKEGLGPARPSLVVLAVYVGNDISENLSWSERRATVASGVLVSADRGGKPSLWARTKAFLVVRSHLARIFVAKFSRRKPRARLVAGEGNPCDVLAWDAGVALAVLRSGEDPLVTRAMSLTCQAIQELSDVVRERGARMLLVFLPAPHQYHPGALALAKEACALGEDEFDLDRPQRTLRACAPEGIPILDLTPELRRWCEQRESERPFFDVHFNAVGNRIVGEAMASWISDLDVLDRSD